MIYRVEFRKDGSVASCEPVESQLKNGGLVCYVEASSAIDALAQAKKRFAAWARADEDKARASGKCPRCGKREPAEGKAHCARCTKQVAAINAERRITSAADDQQQAARADAIAARRRENLAKGIAAARITLTKAADARWDARASASPQERRILRQCLRAYDRNPSAFREWLLRMLGEATDLAASELAAWEATGDLPASAEARIAQARLAAAAE